MENADNKYFSLQQHTYTSIHSNFRRDAGFSASSWLSKLFLTILWPHSSYQYFSMIDLFLLVRTEKVASSTENSSTLLLMKEFVFIMCFYYTERGTNRNIGGSSRTWSTSMSATVCTFMPVRRRR